MDSHKLVGEQHQPDISVADSGWDISRQYMYDS